MFLESGIFPSPFYRESPVWIPAPGGGGGGPLIASASAVGTSSGSTTPPIDTTGASLIVIGVSYSSTGTPVISDSEGNTWIPRTAKTDPITVAVQLYYCLSPITSAAQTFTINGASIFAPITVAAFSLVASYDTESAGGNGSGTTVQPGSLSPAGNGELFVTIVGGVNASASIDSSFVKVEDVAYVGSVSWGVSLAYKVQTPGAAENPTWTVDPVGSAAVMAAFSP